MLAINQAVSKSKSDTCFTSTEKESQYLLTNLLRKHTDVIIFANVAQ